MIRASHTPKRLARESRGAMAAEFALVLPVFILFLIGIIDVGYYAWQINRAEKAVQIGARWAVATDMVPAGLVNYSFAVSGGVPQGTPVPQASFPTVTCDSAGCSAWGYNGGSFNAIVARMQEIRPEIQASEVRIEYSWSGLGYAGDPNGPDVAPIVTVRLVGMQHTPISSLFLGSFNLPDFAYSLTSEDSVGSLSN